ncbi:hypothetical protein BDW42DRAFT_172014 [Aspergillus taichungensis]|uniref:Uncharacterized protein n=1 Tax=Aspergillus taichungensis TaxID=482145 RepID=A0A2J5HRT3_9EURO|nr:hypothetical protein BDW42DRAFT_172014 [Aspergillus taichungensis]
MATTPPPPSPSALRCPPTPRHGAGYDQYEPYSTRYSARLASQRASRERNTTPPPSFPSHAHSNFKTGKKQSDSEPETLSPPKSAQTSPRKKRLARDGSATIPYSLGGPAGLDADPFSSDSLHSQRLLHSHTATMTEGMLPTPAKTPRKKPVGDLGTTARSLFPPSSSSGRKKTKKHTGFSLDSFEESGPSGNQIQIYTDSRDRIPEVDQSENNPFTKKPAPSMPTTRSSRRRDGGKRDKEVDEAIDREDGMVYVFRGKKTFRKFHEEPQSEEEDEDDDLGLLASRPDLIDSSVVANIRPLTRSSIKPRVLFPRKAKNRMPPTTQDDHEEEAATDIEDHAVATDNENADTSDHVADMDMPQRAETPTMDSAVETPESPGATIRSLRPRGKRDILESGETPTATAGKKRGSPFDGWLRKKPTPAVAASKAKKRDAAESSGSPIGPVAKKTRSTRAHAAS